MSTAAIATASTTLSGDSFPFLKEEDLTDDHKSSVDCIKNAIKKIDAEREVAVVHCDQLLGDHDAVKRLLSAVRRSKAALVLLDTQGVTLISHSSPEHLDRLDRLARRPKPLRAV